MFWDPCSSHRALSSWQELQQAKEELENIKQQKERDAAIALKQSEACHFIATGTPGV